MDRQDLGAIARRIIDSIAYMVLGTADWATLGIPCILFFGEI